MTATGPTTWQLLSATPVGPENRAVSGAGAPGIAAGEALRVLIREGDARGASR